MKKTEDKIIPKKSRVAVNQTATKKEYKQSQKQESKAEEKFSNKLVKIMISLVLVILAIVFVFVSGAFDIAKIVVEGNNKISDNQIISFSGIEKGTNLFAISKNDISSKLQENPYVDHVQIKRVLPNTVKLIIQERVPEYALQLANSYIYISRQGYVLEISNNSPNIPILLGCTTDLSNIKENHRLDEMDLNKMKMVVKIMEIAKNHEMENLITKVDISDEKNYTIYLDTEGKIAYLGDGNELNTRFLYIKAILKKQQGKKGEIFVNVDLNSEYVYFKEENG